MRSSLWAVASIGGGIVAQVLMVSLVHGTASGQEVLQQWSGSSSLFNYGFRVAPLGDVDDDGIGDVVIGALTSPVDPPRFEIRSTRSGALLLSVDHGPAGFDVAGAGDLDGDGADDLLIGARYALDVLSGRTGAQLLHVPSRDLRGNFLFGVSVAGVGDVDGDGVPDVAGGGVLQGFGIGDGYATVNSGNDGHAIHEFLGNVDDENGFGYALAPLADLDGDGVRELAVGVPGGRSSQSGFVRIFSLKSGAVIATVDGPAGFFQFGAALAACRDLNGDGIEELLVAGASEKSLLFYGPDQVWVLSGADRSTLAHLQTPPGADFFGRRLAGAGDVNGDGRGDFVVATEFSTGPAVRESARLYDGRTLETLYTTEASGALNSVVAGVADVDGDHYDDFLVGVPMLFPGVVTLYAGDDLFVDATPTLVGAGDELDRTIRTGVPGKLALLALVAINGTPFFLVADGPRVLDATGSLRSSIVVPPGLSGLTLGYQGFAINARGKLSRTAVENVEFE